MPKIGFPMPTAKNRFQILNLHSKKHVLKKPGLKGKNYQNVGRTFNCYCQITVHSIRLFSSPAAPYIYQLSC